MTILIDIGDRTYLLGESLDLEECESHLREVGPWIFGLRRIAEPAAVEMVPLTTHVAFRIVPDGCIYHRPEKPND